MNEVWLVRHGATEWSEDGRHTGRTDLALTPLGEEQAKRSAAWLDGHELALVLCSPMLRARETARAAGLLDRAEITPLVCEWDYGDYEGKTTAEIREQVPGWSVWSHPEMPNGETADQVGARADEVIARCEEAGGDVAVFSHGHFLRILGARWIGEPALFGQRLALDTATLSVLGHEHEYRVLRVWNGGAR